MPKALLIRNGVTKLYIHIRDIIPDRSTVLDFYQMAPPSGSIVPFVLVLNIVCKLLIFLSVFLSSTEDVL